MLPSTPASSRGPASGPQPTAASKPPQADLGNLADDDFSGGIERGMTVGPSFAGPNPHHTKSVSMDFGPAGADQDFGDSLERGAGGGGMPSSSMAPSVSRPPVSRAPASLDVSYRRTDARPAPRAYEPATWEKILARVVPAIGFAAVFAPLVKTLHRPGAYAILKVAPHAFDATSTVLSGITSGVMLIASIAVGYIGLRRRIDRSYAMAVAAGLLLLTCLAMVTVTLVSTDEVPQPPDGARLIPYLVPAAILLLGLGTMGRGVRPFFRGGARRALSFVFGVLGGAIAYAALALSNW
jgi:hypothetical protein